MLVEVRDEFHLSLPSFNEDDQVAWITRVETCFEVQSIFEDIGIKLAKLGLE